jgi:hypothetical protein
MQKPTKELFVEVYQNSWDSLIRNLQKHSPGNQHRSYFTKDMKVMDLFPPEIIPKEQDLLDELGVPVFYHGENLNRLMYVIDGAASAMDQIYQIRTFFTHQQHQEYFVFITLEDLHDYIITITLKALGMEVDKA